MLTPGEAAKIAGVPRRELSTWIKTGQLHAYRVGEGDPRAGMPRVRVREDRLREFLAARS